MSELDWIPILAFTYIILWLVINWYMTVKGLEYLEQELG